MKNIPSYKKLKIKFKDIFLNAVANTPFQFTLYTSYWHYRFNKFFRLNAIAVSETNHYMAEKPNHEAGIGHQLANWNAGYFFSRFFNLKFAHFPFSNQKWETLLGFGEKEMGALTLMQNRNFKKVKLPRFDSGKKEHVQLIGNIIKSYNKKNLFFLLAQDQGYVRQFDTHKELSGKFFAASARKDDKLLYNSDDFNIAIHIRRGDIALTGQQPDSFWEARWLTNNYYVNVLKQVLSNISTGKNIRVHLFSQGNKEDFPEFNQFGNIHFCLSVNANDSFVHMVYADLLISSKSSFSYKPALISKGIKICPQSFWHAYPASNDFILADDNGKFDESQLININKQELIY